MAGFNVDYTPLVDASRTRGAVLGSGLQAIGEGFKERKREAGEQARADEIKGLSARALGGDITAQQELAYTDPAISKEMMEQYGAANERQQKALIADATTAVGLHRAGDTQGVINFLTNRVQTITDRGGDPAHTQFLLSKYSENPEIGGKFIESELRGMVDPKGFVTGLSPEGKEDGVNVKSSEILEDGTVIQSTTKGPVVYNPQGELVKGKDAADAIAQGRAEKVSNLRLAAGEKKAAALESELALKAQVESGVISAKDAAKISSKAFDRLEKVDKNIANLREGIELVRGGAETGAITSRLPSMREASIKLDNLQGRLGLDVVGATTFGALSESELRFAKDTALPKKLQGPALIDWLEEKIAAQEKLSDTLEAAAIYLGTPGNTVSGWVEMNKQKREGVPKAISTQAEYDNLPSGAVFIEDGQQYRKP